MLDCFTELYSPMYLCDIKYSGMLFEAHGVNNLVTDTYNGNKDFIQERAVQAVE